MTKAFHNCLAQLAPTTSHNNRIVVPSLSDLLIAVALEKLHDLLGTSEVVEVQRPKMQCARCGGAMISLGYFPPPPIIQAETMRGRAPP